MVLKSESKNGRNVAFDLTYILFDTGEFKVQNVVLVDDLE